MAVKLRLRRQGRSKAAQYSIVAADARAPRDGKFIEKVGFYNPKKEPAELYLNEEIALKWLSRGAQPTDTVKSLFRHAGINLRFALIKQGKSEEEQKRIYDRWWSENGKNKQAKYQFLTPQTTPKKLHHGPQITEQEVKTETNKEAKEETSSES